MSAPRSWARRAATAALLALVVALATTVPCLAASEQPPAPSAPGTVAATPQDATPRGGEPAGAAREETPDPSEEAIAPLPSDPLRLWNRAMFAVNDKLYFWVLQPTARGYKAVVPSPVRTGVKNFFHNLATPIRLLNNALQGKTRETGVELGSFMINTVWGLFGFIDWTANDPDLRIPEEDTGQTLGRWGIGAGPYVVWPLFGPSSVRDTFGMVTDWFLDPVWYVRPPLAAVGVATERRVNDLTFRLGDYEELKAAAVDPYEAVRDAYLQYRAAQVKK